MNLKNFCLPIQIDYLIVLLVLITKLPNYKISATEDANNTDSNLQMNMGFQKAQQRLMNIPQKPSFNWILEKLAQTPTHDNHAPMDDTRSLEANKDNLQKENFKPENRGSLLQANHAIAHLMYQGDMLLSKQQAENIFGNTTKDFIDGQGSKREKRQAVSTGASFPRNRYSI